MAIYTIILISCKRNFSIGQINSTNTTFEAIWMKHKSYSSNYFTFHFSTTHFAIHSLTINFLKDIFNKISGFFFLKNFFWDVPCNIQHKWIFHLFHKMSHLWHYHIHYKLFDISGSKKKKKKKRLKMAQKYEIMYVPLHNPFYKLFFHQFQNMFQKCPIHSHHTSCCCKTENNFFSIFRFVVWWTLIKSVAWLTWLEFVRTYNTVT